MIDLDILKAELVILNKREEELMLELEEVRATSAAYQHDLEIMEE